MPAFLYGKIVTESTQTTYAICHPIREKERPEYSVHIQKPLFDNHKAKDDKISFNLLHQECGSRIQQKRVCPVCGKEVSNDDLVKGYEYEKGKYVTLTDDDFEKIKTEKDKTIHILQFTDLENINPIYFEKSYYAIPDAGGEKAFELLRTAMLDENKVAIAKTFIGNAATSSETLLALVPTSQGILIETLFYESEVKPLPKNYAKPAVVETELTMAKTMISADGTSHLKYPPIITNILSGSKRQSSRKLQGRKSS